VNICLECNTGEISFEIKTEVDSNDIVECSCDDQPSSCMFSFPNGMFSLFSSHIHIVSCCVLIAEYILSVDEAGY